MMDNKMRRTDKELPEAEVLRLLQTGEYGVLSTVDAGGQPYGVPLNFVYRDSCIYFHCAHEGRKLDNLRGNERVSFCVTGHTRLLPAEFNTEFESVIVSGRASVIHGQERHQALLDLVAKYSPGFIEEGRAYIDKHDSRTTVVRIRVERMSGKAKRAAPI